MHSSNNQKYSSDDIIKLDKGKTKVSSSRTQKAQELTDKEEIVNQAANSPKHLEQTQKKQNITKGAIHMGTIQEDEDEWSDCKIISSSKFSNYEKEKGKQKLDTVESP